MSIKRIVESKQVEHVRAEKNILSKIHHPFLVRLFWATHTNSLLYLLLEYLPGGELFQMMRKREKFDPKVALFYASEVLLGLDYLHHLDILYRDLKPVGSRDWRVALMTVAHWFRRIFYWTARDTSVWSISDLPKRRRNAHLLSVAQWIILLQVGIRRPRVT